MYSQIAHVYDQIHADLKGDIHFLIRQKSIIKEPILELGCGTGRMVIALARLGYQVTGVDNSEEMLDIAKRKIRDEGQAVRERIELVEGDITSFELSKGFGLVIIGHNTLYHLNHTDRNVCFKLIYRHLLPGGTLFIDIDNPADVADPIDNRVLLLERSFERPGKKSIVVQMTSSWVDPDTRERHMTWIFDESPLTRGPVTRSVVESIFYYVDSHDLERELSSAQLALSSTYGDYDALPFREESPRLLLLAEKKINP